MGNREVISALQAQVDSIMVGCAPRIGSMRENERTADRAADSGSALKKVIALVNVSDRSERAIRERLARDGFDPQSIDEAVDEAKAYGFIDDRRYADVLIRSRISQGRGSAGIERELSENGIDAGSVEGWPYDYPVSAEEEFDRALALLSKKPPRSKNPRESAYRRLVQKGYPSSVASSAARTWSESASGTR